MHEGNQNDQRWCSLGGPVNEKIIDIDSDTYKKKTDHDHSCK